MRFLSFLASSLSAVGLASALGQERVISFKPVEGGLKLAGSNWGSGPGAIYIDGEDWPGVLRAGQDLADDFGRVVGENGLTREVANGTAIPSDGSPGIIVAGTIGKSRLIDTLVENKKIDVSETEGQWEAFQTQLVSNPFDGVAQALIVSGSDKRGTIYGLYDISEQIGVSPWYWWADVASDHHEEIFAMAKTKVQGSPSVKYRGFFLNDEQPALTNWVNDNYPKSEYGPGFNSDFYATVFELLLRLRANYIWPTMWDSMIGVDDELTLPLADLYGIVMGTSHTEPLMAQTKEQTEFLKGEWNWDTNQEEIYDFLKERVERSKNFETVYTMGMRGLGDTASPTITAELLEDIVNAQQQILSEVFNTTDVSNIPQMWCVYKEVGEYFEDGMVVPDDVTILWPDDNWGNAQRLPTSDEVDRASGAGLYYHFDYVGDPMNYKWINTILLQKTWEQLRLTYEREARQIWIVNVGDLKPLEVPISHYFDLAYDMPRWSAPDSTSKWLEAWATREFGADVSEATRKVMDKYSMYAARRKYELLETRTYSLLNYNEADRVLAQWKNLVREADEIYNGLSSARQPAFFEMVLHPCMAGHIVTELYITAGKNNLYATQRRTSANALADKALKLFNDDYELTVAYHNLLEGKWNHMMDQTHIGYTYWQQPMRNTIPPLAYTQLQEVGLAGEMGVSVEGSEGAVGGDDEYNVANSNNTLVLPPMDPYGPSSRWIDIYSRGTGDFEFSAVPDNPWVIATPSSGSISAEGGPTDVRVQLSIDWKNAPEGSNIAFINVLIGSEEYGNFDNPSVHLPIEKTSVPSTFHGFIESDRTVSIEAAHTSRRTSLTENSPSYIEIPNYGCTESGITLLPAVIPSTLDPAISPALEYDIYTFTQDVSDAKVTVYLGPSLNTLPDRPLKYAIGFDDAEPQIVQYVPSTPLGSLPDEWEDVVRDAVWKSRTGEHALGESGKHTLKLWAMEPGVVFQKVVIDLGGVRDSYLGPPESTFV